MINTYTNGKLLQPDFIKEFTTEAKAVLTTLGSQFIEHLVQYDSFLMVSKVGGRVLHEALRPLYSMPTLLMVQDGKHWDGTPMTVELLIDSETKGEENHQLES